jgi:hypothetical protein
MPLLRRCGILPHPDVSGLAVVQSSRKNDFNPLFCCFHLDIMYYSIIASQDKLEKSQTIDFRVISKIRGERQTTTDGTDKRTQATGRPPEQKMTPNG